MADTVDEVAGLFNGTAASFKEGDASASRPIADVTWTCDDKIMREILSTSGSPAQDGLTVVMYMAAPVDPLPWPPVGTPLVPYTPAVTTTTVPLQSLSEQLLQDLLARVQKLEQQVAALAKQSKPRRSKRNPR